MSDWTSADLAAIGRKDESYKPGKGKARKTPSKARGAQDGLRPRKAEIVPYSEREAAITRRVYLPVTPLGKPPPRS